MAVMMMDYGTVWVVHLGKKDGGQEKVIVVVVVSSIYFYSSLPESGISALSPARSSSS